MEGHLLGEHVPTMRAALSPCLPQGFSATERAYTKCLTSGPRTQSEPCFWTTIIPVIAKRNQSQQWGKKNQSQQTLLSALWDAQVQQSLDADPKSTFNIMVRANTSILFECLIPFARIFKEEKKTFPSFISDSCFTSCQFKVIL